MQPSPTLPVLFTIDDLSRMIDAGVFVGRTGRIELIEGELRAMSPASEEHDDVVRYLDRWSQRVVGEQFHVAVQQGLRLLKTESMPEPDLYWVDASYRRGRPTPAVVPLVIEVGLSSLDYDLTVKQQLYAMEQIPEYWVVDPRSETIIVHRQPLGNRYAKVDTFGIGQTASPQCLTKATLDLHWLFRE